MAAVPWPMAPSPMMPSVEPCRSPMSMREEAELIGLVPHAVLDVLAVGEKIAPQRQNQRERMFRHGVHGVIADVGDGDAVLLAVGDVDHVVAGRRDGDHLEVGQLLESGRAHRHLVDDRDVGAREARHDLLDRGLLVLDVFGRTRRLAHLGLERGAVQEYDPAGHAALPVFEPACGTTCSAGAAGLLRQ